MIENYRVVCVTPAGRRRYLNLLARYILTSSVVDEYHLWKNTTDDYDIAYLSELQAESSKVRIIEPPLYPPKGNSTISQFFRTCVDADTIYVRFDDDIVYVEPDFFDKFLRFRIENKDYFLVFPNIINNALCSYILIVRGTIEPGAQMVHPWCMDRITWATPHFAEQLHRTFLRAVASGELRNWYFGPTVVALNRFSINCMAWFGKDFAAFDGVVPQDEEAFLTVVKPLELHRANCIFGEAVVSHFAFYSQRQYLDGTDVLRSYAALTTNDPSAHSKGADTEGYSSACYSSRSKDCMTDSRINKFWTPRLVSSIKNILNTPISNLQQLAWLTHRIRATGLVYDLRIIYGYDNMHMNCGHFGLYQMPAQLAGCLIQLSKYKINSVIDIGTLSGWTTSLVTAYLARFNPGVRVTTVDVEDYFDSYTIIRDMLPIQFEPGKTSKDFSDHLFDLAIIDGDHRFKECLSDYEAVGRKAAICMFHDINDRFVRSDPSADGGVPRLWRKVLAEELAHTTVFASEAFEFLDHSEGESIMGIGLIARDHAERRQPPSIWDRVLGRRSRMLRAFNRK